MVQEDDYTFVTIDGDDMGISDAVVVDVNAEGGLLDAVTIDSDAVTVDGSDFITLADDTMMISDADMMDGYSIDMDGTDISFIL